ncbi:probable 2-oxoglutarate-dependent dioxygenase AOP1 [Actinidia eriantha]|uniref:probable 2-oxoglutarate-dependent dioxygenase AOP1 n=1 Tax=Actinidia eriantha TaxID=165200 RepID=UPI00258D96CF|nr:probable 2-oxoglutarate-dependent dioxygenase AOP1 [Actinidia eriantha]
MDFLKTTRVAAVPSNIEHPAPPSNIGLIPHTDKNFLTILCQNEVQGLEVLSRESGNWVRLMIPQGFFVILVGDSLKAWSNGKLHAAKHRVTMKGDKERFSFGLFLSPKEDATIEVPQTLVDKDHPLLYRPFTYSDFLNFYSSNIFSDDALHLFAAI